MIKRILPVLIFFISLSKLYADGGCTGAASFTTTFDQQNCCWSFYNTTYFYECGPYFICTWDFGDGTPSYTGPQANATACHHYAMAGTYTVSLIFDMSQCSHAPSTCYG